MVALGFRVSNLIRRRLLERQRSANTSEQIELLLQEAGICDAAGGGTVTAARGVAERTPRLPWFPIGDVKGIPDPVPLVRLDVASPEVEQV